MSGQVWFSADIEATELQITTEADGSQTVIVDGVDLSDRLKGLDLHIRAGRSPLLTLYYNERPLTAGVRGALQVDHEPPSAKMA